MSIYKSRASIGLSTPTPEFKRYWWKHLRIPSARIDSGYSPIPSIERVHDHPARIRQLSGGARLGKSLFIAAEAIPWAFHSSLIWLLGPDYSQTRQEFLYIVEGLVSIGATNASMISIPATKSVAGSLETMWGCQIETLTTQDPEKIASKAPDIIFMCEPGQIQDGIFDRTLERLTTKRGGLVLAGTFEENSYMWFQDNWLKWRKWPNESDGKSFSVPMWENTYTFPGGRNDPEIRQLEAALPKDVFLRRIAGIPTPSRKLIIGDVWRPINSDGSPNQVGFHAFDRTKPVSLCIDPGWGSDSYYYVGAIQWEWDGEKEIYKVVDEVALQHHTHNQVIQECMKKSWWGNIKDAIVEPWGGLSNALGNDNAVDVWRKEVNNTRPAPRISLDERVTYLRDALHDPIYGEPRIFFNASTTPRIQYEAAHWRRMQVRSNSKRPGGPSELHCDGLKALASWLTDRVKFVPEGGPKVRELTYVY